jgi:hypothetical protein
MSGPMLLAADLISLAFTCIGAAGAIRSALDHHWFRMVGGILCFTLFGAIVLVRFRDRFVSPP